MKFNNKIDIGHNQILDECYVSLNNLFTNWGNIMAKQMQIVNDEIANTFKYLVYYNAEVKMAVKTRNNMQNQYSQLKANLLKKKEQLFLKGDVNKWDLQVNDLLATENILTNKLIAFEHMLPKETGNLKNLRNQYAFYNNQMFTEIKAAVQNQCLYLSQNFCKVSGKQMEQIKEYHELWTNLQNNVLLQEDYLEKYEADKLQEVLEQQLKNLNGLDNT